jgi:hypothetical protein
MRLTSNCPGAYMQDEKRANTILSSLYAAARALYQNKFV